MAQHQELNARKAPRTRKGLYEALEESVETKILVSEELLYS